MWDLRGQVGKQTRYRLDSYQRMSVVVASDSGNDDEEALNSCQKTFEIAIWVLAVTRGREIH
jgi:hypothetical protein